MIITKKAIPRRTVLRGFGASLALPLLDAMVPAFARAHERRDGARHPFRRRLRAERDHDAALDAGY